MTAEPIYEEDPRSVRERVAEGDTYGLEPGARWKNVHTGTEDEILRMGPCPNLDGEQRIWLVREQAERPSNGWSLHHFGRCWRLMQKDHDGV